MILSISIFLSQERWTESIKKVDSKNSLEKEITEFSSPEIERLRDGVAAVYEEERLRWLIEGVKLKVSVWQSIGANQRAEAKSL